MYVIKVVWYPQLPNKQNTVYFNNTQPQNIFKNKLCLSYHYYQKMVDAGARTAAGSCNGVVNV